MVGQIRQQLVAGFLWWVGLPVLITLLGMLPGQLVSQSTLLLLYLCAVLFTSLRAAQSVVMACALLSFLLFNYFHTQPRFSLMIQAPDEGLAAAVFVVFALLAGRVAGKLNWQLTRLRILKDAERKADEEKLRSALLSSVSHDLKTPLVTMMGAATSLRDLHADLSAADSAELLDSIISESQRMERYIQNLLDMTRLGHGKLSLSRAWVSVEEIYHVVEKRIALLLPRHSLRFRQAGEIPALHVHAALIEQALFNVIDNALKAGGSDSEIVVAASWTQDIVTIQVSDRGPGLPPSEWEAAFDQFHTFSLGDCYDKGTGLGLSICRSICRVHGGEARITSPSPPFRHCVELTLPAAVVSMDETGSDETSGND